MGAGVPAGAAETAPPPTAPPPAGAVDTAPPPTGVVDTVDRVEGDTLVPDPPTVSPTAVTPGAAAGGPIAEVDEVGAVEVVEAAEVVGAALPADVVGTVTAGVGPSVVGTEAMERGGTVVALAPAELRTPASTSVGAAGSTDEAEGVPGVVDGGAALFAGAVPVTGGADVLPLAPGTPVGTPAPGAVEV